MSIPTIFVLSTQTLPASLIEAAAASGVQLDAVTFIRTELLEVRDWPTDPTIAVFTSQHAVGALPHIGANWRLFCLGGATRRMLEKRLGGAMIPGRGASGEELAKGIIAGQCGK